MNILPLFKNPAAAVVLTMASTAAVVLGGCASAPLPVEQLAVAEASVQHATTTSTSESAPGELQLATSKLASARQAVTSKDNERAKQLAEQAEVDALAAEIRAQAVRSAKAATESQEAARVLREEIARKTPR